jgi:UDP-N-acetyl-D-glucosamine dehydrogenase
VAEHQISLAINGREHDLRGKLVPFLLPADHAGRANGSGRAEEWSVAIVGLGYVGLPTALALHSECPRIIGIDISQGRLDTISAGEADLSAADRHRLDATLRDGSLELTTDPRAAAEADAVIISVPTPVDAGHMPDLSALRSACAAVVTHARDGQTIILTSTSYAGTTRDMLIGPLEERGMRVGSDVFVAFSPERIDPGNAEHLQRETPRVVGGATAECADRAARVIRRLTDNVYLVSSPEAAEATKLYENIFRAVTLALANEFADICGALQLDPIEVTLAAGTKPYGFLGTFPGPGVGGHCIPCDPYYLLWQLGKQEQTAPLIQQAMRSIELRPQRVIDRAGEVLADGGGGLAGARVMIVGASYKGGVGDMRESPALAIIAGLARQGADVCYHDPLVPSVQLRDGRVLHSVPAPCGADWDLAIIHTLHPGVDYSWARDCPRVLDATYRFDAAPQRALV